MNQQKYQGGFFSFCRALLLVLLYVSVAASSFFPAPFLKWTHTLPGSGQIGHRSLRKGNAVRVSEDGEIFVTADDGSLHILSPDLDSTSTYEPSALPGTYTEGRSGVSIFEAPEGDLYAVYAVVDVPIIAEVPFEGSDDLSDIGLASEVKSRVIAVNDDGSQRWSVFVNGNIVGTPVIGNTGETVYVSTNIPIRDGDGKISVQGRVQVIRENGKNPFVTASKFLSDRKAPFGPLGIRTLRSNGSDRDVVFFTESWEDGFVGDGRLYFLTPSARHDELSGIGGESYDLNTFSNWGRSSVVRPTVSIDGLSLWTGGTGSVVAGWPGAEDLLEEMKTDVPLGPMWETQITPSDRNATQPLTNSPVVSDDNQYLYINGEAKQLVCLEAKSGKVVWVDSISQSSFMSEPKLSSDGSRTRLYTIELLSGNVRQHDAVTGERYWEFDCSAVSNAASICQDSVEAEFTLSPSGNDLYYGDVFGNVVALHVADFEPTSTPSIAPSLKPSPSPTVAPGAPTANPTAAPTTHPTHAPSPSPTSTPTESPTEAPAVASGPLPSPSNIDINNSPSPSPSSSNKEKVMLVTALTLVSVLGFGAVCLLLLRKQKRRRMKREVQVPEVEEDRRWKQEQRAWAESFRKFQLPTISETKQENFCSIVPSSNQTSFRKSTRRSQTRQTLASIEEVDDEWSVSTDQSKPRNDTELVSVQAGEEAEAAGGVAPVNLDSRLAVADIPGLPIGAFLLVEPAETQAGDDVTSPKTSQTESDHLSAHTRSETSALPTDNDFAQDEEAAADSKNIDAFIDPGVVPINPFDSIQQDTGVADEATFAPHHIDESSLTPRCSNKTGKRVVSSNSGNGGADSQPSVEGSDTSISGFDDETLEESSGSDEEGGSTQLRDSWVLQKTSVYTDQDDRAPPPPPTPPPIV